LARAKGKGGLCQGWPGLDLDEGEQAVAFGDQVNFARFGAHPLAENKPALGSQRSGGEGFGILAGGIGTPSSDKAMGGWGLAGHGMKLPEVW
jgi:hypothetical protein